MAKLFEGINGPFSGKVGTVVGYKWHDIAVIRGRPEKRRKPFTPKELNQQGKYRLMNQLLIPAKDLLNKTFAHLAVRMTGFNKAFSYNVKAAISGFEPDLSIEYAMVMLSRGDLTKAESATVSGISPTELKFSWADNSAIGNASETDEVFVAAFNPEQKHWFYKKNAATRNAGYCTLDFTELNKNAARFAGKPVHTYIGFLSADGKDASESIYTGLLNMPGTE